MQEIESFYLVDASAIPRLAACARPPFVPLKEWLPDETLLWHSSIISRKRPFSSALKGGGELRWFHAYRSQSLRPTPPLPPLTFCFVDWIIPTRGSALPPLAADGQPGREWMTLDFGMSSPEEDAAMECSRRSVSRHYDFSPQRARTADRAGQSPAG